MTNVFRSRRFLVNSLARILHTRCAGLALLAILTLAPAPAPAQVTNDRPIRPITLQECFELALQENLALRIQRINPALSLLDLEVARAGYDPRFNFSGAHSYRASAGGRIPESNIEFQGSKSETDRFNSSIGGLGPYGLSYTLNGNINDTHGDAPSRTNVFFRDPFEDASGAIGISLVQPLLRNFVIDPVRYNIAVAKSQIKGSELDLQNQLINMITAIELAYNNLISARETVKVETEGLRLAQQLLADNRRRVQIGVLAPLDEKQSEAAVYTRQASLSDTMRMVGTAENVLKRLISADYRTLQPARLEPAEVLTAVSQQLNLLESWEAGLSKRPDILQQRRAIELQGLTVRYTKNQRLPEVDITGGYGYSGSGAREYSDVFENITSREQPFWSIGAAVSVPLSNKAARENHRYAKLRADQLVLSLKNNEQQVMVEIDEAMGSVHSARDRIESTRQARIYAEQALDAGQKKLLAGTTTSFENLQLQRELIEASRNEIDAMRDYNNSLANLWRAEGTTLERKKITLEVR